MAKHGIGDAEVVYKLVPSKHGWKTIVRKNGQLIELATDVKRQRAYEIAVEFHHYDRLPTTKDTKSTETTSKQEQGPQGQAASDGLGSAGAGYGSQPSTQDCALFAERLNKLFEANPRPDGVTYTSGEVAASLQEDGLAISEHLITRLRKAACDYPAERTIDALAYFFNVDNDYFSAREDPEAFSEPAPPDVGHREAMDSSRVQVIPISTIELGRIVASLAEATSGYLARSPAEIRTAGILVSSLAEVGALLALDADRPLIGKSLLRRIIAELGSAGRVAERDQQILARLSALVGD